MALRFMLSEGDAGISRSRLEGSCAAAAPRIAAASQSAPPLPDLDSLPLPAWILSPKGNAFHWANAAGLVFWQAGDLGELRDLEVGSGHGGHIPFLAELCEREGPSVTTITLYPGGEARTVACSHWTLDVAGEACIAVVALPLPVPLPVPLQPTPAEAADRLRDRILGTVARSAQRLLSGTGWEQEGTELLRGLGIAAGADRSYFLRFLPPDHPKAGGGAWVARQEIEWCAEDVVPVAGDPALEAVDLEAYSPRLVEHFQRLQPVVLSDSSEYLASERQLLAAQGISTILLYPIHCDGRPMGFIGFDVVGARRRAAFPGWSPQLVEALATGAQLIGAAHQMEETQRRLFKAVAEAQEANRAKSDFLAAMSHDLRTPLNAIIGFSELMLLGPTTAGGQAGSTELLEARRREYLGHILTAGQNLVAMIDDLLDMAKIEAGRMILQERDVDPEVMIDEALSLMPSNADSPTLALDRAPRLEGAQLFCDARLMCQMLTSLLSNAGKYTPAGSRVAVACTRTGDGGLEMAVADDGPGLSREEALRVVEPFSTTDASIARPSEQKSGGLGLALVDRMMKLHGGRLLVETAPGAGLTARLRFPPHRCR